jgi:maltose O-acetyltransferase
MRLGHGSVDLRKPVIIERGCWIGMGATILPGITIAEGCVIAADCTVTKSTAPNGLYAGTPARRIKNLSITPEE